MPRARDELEVRRLVIVLIVELSSASMPPGLATTVLWSTFALAKKCASIATPCAADRSPSTVVPDDRVVLDLALGVVEADDPDAVRAEHVVVADRPHRHLAHRDPAQRRLADVVVLDVDHRHVRDDPLAHADDRAALDHRSSPCPSRTRCRCPAPTGRAAPRRVQSSIITRARRTWMPSSVDADDVHVVEHHVVRVLDVDAVLAADDGDVAQRDVVGADHDAAVDDAADERLRVADHERPLHGAVQVHGRRADGVGARRRRRATTAATATAVERAARGRARRRPRAYSSRKRGKSAWPKSCAVDPADREEQQRPAERRHQVERSASRVDEAELEQRRAAARASPAGSRARGRRRRVEREPEREHQRDELDRPPAVQPEREQRAPGASRRARDWMRPVSVYDIRGSGTRGQRTWRRRSCRRRGTPIAPATPAIDSVRVASVSAGTVESGASAIQRSCVSSSCVVDQVRKQRVLAPALAEPGRGRSPASSSR